MVQSVTHRISTAVDSMLTAYLSVGVQVDCEMWYKTYYKLAKTFDCIINGVLCKQINCFNGSDMNDHLQSLPTLIIL